MIPQQPLTGIDPKAVVHPLFSQRIHFVVEHFQGATDIEDPEPDAVEPRQAGQRAYHR